MDTMRKDLRHAVSRAQSFETELGRAKAHIYDQHRNQAFLQSQLRTVVHVLRKKINDVSFDYHLQQKQQYRYQQPRPQGDEGCHSGEASSYSPSTLVSAPSTDGSPTFSNVLDSHHENSPPTSGHKWGPGILGLSLALSESSVSSPFGSSTVPLGNPMRTAINDADAKKQNDMKDFDDVDLASWVLNRSGAASVPPSLSLFTGVDKVRLRGSIPGSIGLRNPSSSRLSSNTPRAVSDPLKRIVAKKFQDCNHLNTEADAPIVAPLTGSTLSSPLSTTSNSPSSLNMGSTTSTAIEEDQFDPDTNDIYHTNDGGESVKETLGKITRLLDKLEKLVEMVNVSGISRTMISD